MISTRCMYVHWPLTLQNFNISAISIFLFIKSLALWSRQCVLRDINCKRYSRNFHVNFKIFQRYSDPSFDLTNDALNKYERISKCLYWRKTREEAQLFRLRKRGMIVTRTQIVDRVINFAQLCDNFSFVSHRQHRQF